MIRQLQELADIQAGHPFRGSVPAIEDGNSLALQMRDIDPESGVAWSGVVRTQLEESRNPQWLQEGDVVFVARGSRNYAVCLQDVPAHVVCSQYFFLLRSKTRDILPAFLAWQINQAPAQRYLASTAEGTDQLSIRRGVLEALPLAVPPLARQHLIVELATAVREEKKYMETLIQNRQRQLDALAFDLIANGSTVGKPE
jgi:hypothetical protein